MARAGWIALLTLLLAGCASTGQRHSAPVESPAEANAQLGLAYLQQGNREAARDKLKRALELNPNLAIAHHYSAELYRQLGQMDLSEQHYRRAVELQPDDSMLRNNFGVLLCGRNKLEEAEEQFLIALKDPFYKTPQLAYENAGLCALRKPDAAKAEHYFRTALRLDPNLPKSLYEMAALEYGRERYLSARAFLERYFDAAQASPESLRLAMRVERALGDQGAAQVYAERLRQRFPEAALDEEKP